MATDPKEFNKKNDQPENHLQAGQEVNETTVNVNLKQSAKKQWLTIILLLAGGAIITLFLSNFFNSFSKVPEPPNKELIKYLERERQHSDSIAINNMKLGLQYLELAVARRQTDSLMILALKQNMIMIQKMKPQYEKITSSYRNISNDSLRRLFADRFP